MVDGKEIPGTGGILLFQQDRLLLANLSGAYRIDSTQSPPHLDFSLGSDDLDVPYHGLYELAGNTLRICFCTTAGGPRPKAFPAASGDGVELIVCDHLRPRQQKLRPGVDAGQTRSGAEGADC